jgi:hypothetical protein
MKRTGEFVQLAPKRSRSQIQSAQPGITLDGGNDDDELPPEVLERIERNRREALLKLQQRGHQATPGNSLSSLSSSLSSQVVESFPVRVNTQMRQEDRQSNNIQSTVPPDDYNMYAEPHEVPHPRGAPISNPISVRNQAFPRISHQATPQASPTPAPAPAPAAIPQRVPPFYAPRPTAPQQAQPASFVSNGVKPEEPAKWQSAGAAPVIQNEQQHQFISKQPSTSQAPQTIARHPTVPSNSISHQIIDSVSPYSSSRAHPQAATSAPSTPSTPASATPKSYSKSPKSTPPNSASPKSASPKPASPKSASPKPASPKSASPKSPGSKQNGKGWTNAKIDDFFNKGASSDRKNSFSLTPIQSLSVPSNGDSQSLERSLSPPLFDRNPVFFDDQMNPYRVTSPKPTASAKLQQADWISKPAARREVYVVDGSPEIRVRSEHVKTPTKTNSIVFSAFKTPLNPEKLKSPAALASGPVSLKQRPNAIVDVSDSSDDFSTPVQANSVQANANQKNSTSIASTVSSLHQKAKASAPKPRPALEMPAPPVPPDLLDISDSHENRGKLSDSLNIAKRVVIGMIWRDGRSNTLSNKTGKAPATMSFLSLPEAFALRVLNDSQVESFYLPCRDIYSVDSWCEPWELVSQLLESQALEKVVYNLQFLLRCIAEKRKGIRIGLSLFLHLACFVWLTSSSSVFNVRSAAGKLVDRA